MPLPYLLTKATKIVKLIAKRNKTACQDSFSKTLKITLQFMKNKLGFLSLARRGCRWLFLAAYQLEELVCVTFDHVFDLLLRG